LTAEQVAARLPALAKKDLLEWSPIPDAAAYLTPVLKNEYHLLDPTRADRRLIITDDRPFNEYFLLRTWNVLQY
jgi:hypothetical protein